MPTSTKPWFIVKEILHNLWAISEQGWDTAYLAVGKTGALLVDTCFGIGDLRSVVESITRMPVTVVHTHGHGDHACGSYQFEAVHVMAEDVKLLASNYTPEARMQHAKNFGALMREQGRSPSAVVAAAPPKIEPIGEGRVFDLGGRVFRTIAVPGHTAGSLCLFEPNGGILLTGDSILEGDIFLHLRESLSPAVYLNSLRRLCASARSARYILPGHNRTPIEPLILGEVIEGVKSIIAGRRKDAPFRDGGLKACFGNASVIYKPS
jgi:hydroxyacylglutathione hydrolase